MKYLDSPALGIPGNTFAGILETFNRDGGEQQPLQRLDAGRRIFFSGQYRPELDLGGKILGKVVLLGHPQPAGADQASGEDIERASLWMEL